MPGQVVRQEAAERREPEASFNEGEGSSTFARRRGSLSKPKKKKKKEKKSQTTEIYHSVERPRNQRDKREQPYLRAINTILLLLQTAQTLVKERGDQASGLSMMKN